MPRIIPDLERKILQAAGQLFIAKGFTEVSMKDVAALVGTSVGNLYNYYPSKKDLFLAGRQVWLEQLRREFQEAVASVAEPRAALRAFAAKLLEGLETWSGLWEEFLAAAKRELKPDEIAAMIASLRAQSRADIIGPLDDLLRRADGPNGRLAALLAAPDLRFATSIVGTVKLLIKLYPGQREENLRFVLTLIDPQPYAEHIKE